MFYDGLKADSGHKYNNNNNKIFKLLGDGNIYVYRRGGRKIPQLNLVVRTQMPQVHMWLVANAASDVSKKVLF
jgi:hypothetical protein